MNTASNRERAGQGTGTPGAWSVARAFAIEGLTSAQRLVLAVLLTRADREGYAWPHASEVAARTTLALRTVARVVAQLAALGLVERAQLRPGELLPNGLPTPDARAVVRATLGSVRAFVGGSIEAAIAPGLGLSPTERAVLAALLLHANGSRQAWATQARLAAVAGCSVRSVGAALAELRARRMIALAMLPPGATLPNGASCAGWRALVTILPGGIRARAAEPEAPRRSCSSPPALVQPPPGEAAEGRDPENTDPEKSDAREGEPSPIGAPQAAPMVSPAAPASGAAAPPNDVPDLLLAEWAQKLGSDVGPNARALLAARLAEGVTPREIRDGIEGIRLLPWRMDPCWPTRRYVANCFQYAAKVRTFAAAARCANPEVEILAPPPAPERLDPETRKAQAAQLRAILAAGPARPFFLSRRAAVDRA